MNSPIRFGNAIIGAMLLLCFLPSVQAVASPDYTITYSISITDDGTADWQIEYRTLLLTDEDMTGFENYSRNLNAMYLPELRALIQQSAAQAAQGTSRDMTVNDFTGNALVQTSPSGKYGVVTYTFTWTQFAGTDDGLTIGDAFAGGMFLARDNTLIIRYPPGYAVMSIQPVPDQTGDGLTWYGLRSFGPGQPAIVLKRAPIPLLPIFAGGLIVVVLAIAGIILYLKRTAGQKLDNNPDEEDENMEHAGSLSPAEMETLEEKILQILISRNGELYQSEIVRELGLPKSSVSTTLNDLHQRAIIQKVRKGRENLIRLVRDRDKDLT